MRSSFQIGNKDDCGYGAEGVCVVIPGTQPPSAGMPNGADFATTK